MDENQRPYDEGACSLVEPVDGRFPLFPGQPEALGHQPGIERGVVELRDIDPAQRRAQAQVAGDRHDDHEEIEHPVHRRGGKVFDPLPVRKPGRRRDPAPDQPQVSISVQ